MTSKIIVQIDEDNVGSQSEISLKKVREVLQTYQDDTGDYNRKLEKNRLGKGLTIIDSSISDETQRKAVKDLIHDAWYGANSHFIDGHPHYPQLRHVTEALGFTLYDGSQLLSQPESTAREHNPYKKITQ